MPPIRTWDELIEDGDIALTKDLVEYAFTTRCEPEQREFTANLAVVKHDADGLLRIETMMHLISIPHLVGDEIRVVVIEGEKSVERGYGPYLQTAKCSPARYRTAEHLGLDGTPHTHDTHSVLIPHDKLHLISFTDAPEPLSQWERELNAWYGVEHGGTG